MEATPIRKPIREAAKVVHKSRAYVRSLIEKGKLTAYRLGGKDKAPWLAVDVEQLRLVIDQESVYVPPAVAKAQKEAAKTRKPNRAWKLHPAAAAM